MIEIIIAGIVGVALGVGSTLGISAVHKKNAPPIIIQDDRGKIEQEVVKELTNLELTREICSEDKNLGLCRELICYQFGKGLGSQTSQGQCESISNINNKIELFEYCRAQDDFDRCIDIFWRRN